MRIRAGFQNIIKVVKAATGAQDHDPCRLRQLLDGILDVIAVATMDHDGWLDLLLLQKSEQVLLRFGIRIISFGIVQRKIGVDLHRLALHRMDRHPFLALGHFPVCVVVEHRHEVGVGIDAVFIAIEKYQLANFARSGSQACIIHRVNRRDTKLLGKVSGAVFGREENRLKDIVDHGTTLISAALTLLKRISNLAVNDCFHCRRVDTAI